MRDVMFLPGIIAPAAIRYEALIARLPEVNALPKDLEVYASDTPPPDYSVALEVAGVDRAADEARFERFHLFGHSGGGAIALAYAAAHPKRLLSLAVDEPAYDFTQEAHADMDEFRPLASLPVPERMQAFMKLQVSAGVELPPRQEGPPPAWMGSRPAGIDAFLIALESHARLEERFASFRSPVLFTWGSLTHPRWNVMKERLAKLFTDFTAERFEGLHPLNTSHQAEPDRVAKLLLDFWGRAEAV